MTLATLDGRVFEPPPLRPPWLRPLVIAVVIALHAAALSLVYLAPRPIELPRTVVVDIEPEAPPSDTPAPQPNRRSRPTNPRLRQLRTPPRLRPSRRLQSLSHRQSRSSRRRRRRGQNLRRPRRNPAAADSSSRRRRPRPRLRPPWRESASPSAARRAGAGACRACAPSRAALAEAGRGPRAKTAAAPARRNGET